jgi:Zn-dependent protease with chaperone function
MDVMAMEPVIAHEKAHLARRDHWWKPMGFLILAVH